MAFLTEQALYSTLLFSAAFLAKHLLFSRLDNLLDWRQLVIDVQYFLALFVHAGFDVPGLRLVNVLVAEQLI